MENELVLKQFNASPDNLQRQVIDFMNFLSLKYIQKSDNNNEIPQEIKELLISRADAYEQNPKNTVTWQDIEDRYEKKYGYEI